MREAWGREAKKKTSVGRREELAREESRQVCLMFPLASRLLVCLPLLIFSIWFYYSYWFQIEVIEALLWLALFHIDCFSFWICWYLFFFTTINPLMVMQYGSFGHPFFSMSDLCSFSPPNSPSHHLQPTPKPTLMPTLVPMTLWRWSREMRNQHPRPSTPFPLLIEPQRHVEAMPDHSSME